MLDPRSFVAVDLGGQSGRVVLGTFARGGLRIDEVHRFANTPVLRGGVLCWDAERLFKETITGIARAIPLAESRGSPVEGIAVDSWGVDYGLADAHGELVSPIRHHRAAEQRFVAVAGEHVTAGEAYSRTGIMGLAINTCFQLVRDAGLGLLEGCPTVLLIPDLWTFWLTGQRAAERTIASTTGLLDWRTGGWAFDLLDRWEIPREILPELVEPGSRAGVTTDAITTRLGASAPVPVYRAAAHDTASAFAAVASPGDPAAVISCGTWALVGCSGTSPVLTEEARAAGFTNEEGIDGSVVFVRNLSGTWLLEECLRAWTAPESDVKDVRQELLVAAAGLEDNVLRATIDPAAPELVERGDMPARIGHLYRLASGEELSLSPVLTVRLILESLALSFATTIRSASRLTGIDFREVRMIGGGSRVDLLVRLTERATGLPVRVGQAEATSIGNLCVQAVAAGVFPTIEEARHRI
jgi:rhamnulokinase